MKRTKIVIIAAVIILAAAVALVLGAHLRQKNDVILIEEESFFLDYEIIDDEVWLRCRVTLCNAGNEDRTVKLRADFSEDVKTGLLKDGTLYASDISGTECVCAVGAGETETVEVVFIGEFGGTNQKHDRLLPEIQVVNME